MNIKDHVPLYIMDWEWGVVKCDFGAIQCCDVSSVTDFFNFTTT